MVFKCFGGSDTGRNSSTSSKVKTPSQGNNSTFADAKAAPVFSDLETSVCYPPWLPPEQVRKLASSPRSSYPVTDVVRVNVEEAGKVLQKLAVLNATSTIALCEAAEILHKVFSASLVSIIGVADPTRFVLLAAHGNGSFELESYPVMQGSSWSAIKLLDKRPYLLASPKNQAEAAALPKDWQLLYEAGCASAFLAVPVTDGNSMLGVVTITKSDQQAFDPARWVPLMQLVSTGLLPYLRNEQTRQVVALLSQLDATPEYLPFIGTLLRGIHTLLLSCTNIRCGCRLGTMDVDMLRTMVFECEQLTPQDVMTLSVSRAAAASTPVFSAPTDVHITELPLVNTLLLDAVQKGKARFVSDCTLYLQSCMKPAADIFISGSQMVASIVVMPLIYHGAAFGGLYFTLDTPCNFLNLKDTLTGLANVAVMLLSKRLQSRMQDMWESMHRGTVQINSPAAETPNGRAAEGGLGGSGSLPTVEHAAAASSGSGSNSAQSPHVTKPVYFQKSATEGIMKVLRHEIQKTKAQNTSHEWVEGLQLLEVIGRGGFGMVYRGRWKGTTAAVKVMYASKQERQMMKDALEIAVLTSVSHPNIIQVYTCNLDVVEDPHGAEAAAQQHGTQLEPGGLQVGFRKLQPEELNSSAVTCNLVIMEFCDKGSLRHALKKGIFHRRVGTTSLAVDLSAIVGVLLEIAQAIQHLHSLKLIHCDIKPENVLLKSDPTKPTGFTTKLSDFGLAKILRENYYVVNRSGSGTVTHLAPELFLEGSRLTVAVDSFSFGIMMWEMYTGQRAYSGLGREAIIDKVYRSRGRPMFPTGAVDPYVALACTCWHDVPDQRPSFDVIVNRLNEIQPAIVSGDMPLLRG